MGKIFGTDGIRGVANVGNITPEMVLKVGKALAAVFRKHGADHRHKVVIGKDTRLSGYMIESALTSGICSMGVDVLLVGPMPTPAIAHLTKSLNAHAGIVLSASHNPAEDNGIKIFDMNGFKLPDDMEAEIEELILSEDFKNEHIKGDLIGKAYRIDDAKGRYIEFCKSSIRSMSLEGIKIVLDCANGAAYKVAPQVFTELGAEVIVLNDKPDGLNINHECGATHPEVIQKATKEHKADIGIALDGDADRIIVCDEKGKMVDGDHIIAICAKYLQEKGLLKNDKVVATVMANIGFDIAMKDLGIEVIKSDVGDRNVKEKMFENQAILGGEQCGHMLFLKYSTTDDGIVAALQLLRVMRRTKKKISELAKVMKSYPQVLINVDVREKPELSSLKETSKVIKEVEGKLKDTGRVLVRYSGTQNVCRVMLEGKSEKEIKQYADKIVAAVKKEIGA